jgi:hypothetical protein
LAAFDEQALAALRGAGLANSGVLAGRSRICVTTPFLLKTNRRGTGQPPAPAEQNEQLTLLRKLMKDAAGTRGFVPKLGYSSRRNRR